MKKFTAEVDARYIFAFLKKLYSFKMVGINFIVFVISVTCGFIYALTLHNGHSWGGDFSQFIHHAKNIVEGIPYANTGYIISNSTRFIAPPTYPPIYPLMLTPIYLLYGIDIEVMKLVGIIFFCFFLLLIPLIFKNNLKTKHHIIIIILLAANPFIWHYSNVIMSEFTFLFFTYLALYIMQRNLDIESDALTSSVIIGAIILGLVMYLSYGCREIGLVLPLCVITYEVIHKRKLSILSIASFLVFFLFAYTQKVILNPINIDSDVHNALVNFSERYSAESHLNSHFDLINIDLMAIIQRMQRYYWSLAEFLPKNDSHFLQIATPTLLNIFLALSIAGYIISLKRKIHVTEIFFAGYISVLLLFKSPSYARYLLPILPLALYYALLAYDQLGLILNRNFFSISLTVTISIIILISYISGIKDMNYRSISYGVGHESAIEMFNFIRNETRADDTIVFDKPRVISLFTERKSIGKTLFNDSPEMINEFYSSASADFYVDSNLHIGLEEIRESRPPTDKFSQVFRNTYFVIYKYNPTLDNNR